MDPNNRMRPQDLTPRGSRPDISGRPSSTSRPLMNDFAPRPMRPVAPQPATANPSAANTPQPVPPAPQANSAPAAPSAFEAHRQPGPAPRTIPIMQSDFRQPTSVPLQPLSNSLPPSGVSKAVPTGSPVAPPSEHKPFDPPKQAPPESTPPKIKNQTGHSGLVGLGVFIVLTIIALGPIVPGKIFQDFPLSSQSFSAGDESLGCIKPLGPVKTNLQYNLKLGFPITYKYQTTTVQTAACESKTLTAAGGHAAQFNPLGAIINILCATLIAFVIAKIWRKLFGTKDY